MSDCKVTTAFSTTSQIIMANTNPRRRSLQLSLPTPLRPGVDPPRPPPLQQRWLAHGISHTPQLDRLVNRFNTFVPANHAAGRGTFPRPPFPQHPPHPYSHGHYPDLLHPRTSSRERCENFVAKSDRAQVRSFAGLNTTVANSFSAPKL